MNEKLRSAVYGFAVGDALGLPYEFRKRDSFRCTKMTGYGTWNQPPGTWSDDTSMTIATCDSIRTLERINPYVIMRNFYLWFYKGQYTPYGKVFDVGNTTRKAIWNFHEGVPALICGLTDEFSNGNGSLMRILPLAFVPHSINDIHVVSGLTHAHEFSTRACEIYLDIAAGLLSGHDVKRTIQDASSFIGFYPPFERLEKLFDLKRDEIKSTGYVVDTLEAALWCFVNTSNYKDCVLTAVNLGGDTDTIAAIAGGLAGLKYGFEAIPAEWIEQLANKDLIERCLF